MRLWFLNGSVYNVLVLTLFLFRCSSQHSHSTLSESQEFDIIIVSQRWPETLCSLCENVNPSQRCTFPANRQEWVIHGVWPSQLHRTSPSCCYPSLGFNTSDLLPIEHQLNQKWTNVCGDPGSFELWQHEWEKHGTCGAVLEEISTPRKYFDRGLALRSEYNITNVLAKANISPGRNYTVNEIIDGVKNVVGKAVVITCVEGTTESYLYEVYICMDKNLELIDCYGVAAYPDNCNHNKPVLYPGTASAEKNITLIQNYTALLDQRPCFF